MGIFGLRFDMPGSGRRYPCPLCERLCECACIGEGGNAAGTPLLGRNSTSAESGQKKANPSYSAVAASSCFFVWELAMSLWIRTFPSKTAPSSMAMRGV